MRRKGELTKPQIDRDWPFQVTMPATDLARQHAAILAFCKPLSLAPRGHTYTANGAYHSVLCFAVEEDADRFAEKFGGARLDPKDRPRWPAKLPPKINQRR